MLMTLDRLVVLFLSGLAAVLPIPFSPCSVVRADCAADSPDPVPHLVAHPGATDTHSDHERLVTEVNGVTRDFVK